MERRSPRARFASSPTRIAVVTPPGSPGPADVRVHDMATAQDRTLAAGFFYDSFVVSPAGGATSGGTLVALQGSGTHWLSTSTVTVGGQPCASVEVTDATHLACITPPGAVGAQDVTVTNSDGSLDQARDAFTYGDSPDGYLEALRRGSGRARQCAGVRRIHGRRDTRGAGHRRIENPATGVDGDDRSSGTALLTAPSLTGQSTITVAAKCHQPVTFVDVPVDTVTAYLSPELVLSCAGDPPSSGNGSVAQEGAILGELVWQGGIEFNRGAWANVPSPIGNERQAAYAFIAGSRPRERLLSAARLERDDADERRAARICVHARFPERQPDHLCPGGDRCNRPVDPPTFVPYAMGLARGVFVSPGPADRRASTSP